jgi:hypothetical protein
MNKEFLQLLQLFHRQRCAIQGCVYIPDKNGTPNNVCNYCGEPAPFTNRFFGEPMCDLRKK